MSLRFGQLFSTVFLVAALAGCESSSSGPPTEVHAAAVSTPDPAGVVPGIEPPLSIDGVVVDTPAIALERTAAAISMRTPTLTDDEVKTQLIIWADADPEDGEAPLTVSFSCRPLEEVGTVTYEWDFGDGSAKVTEANPTHTYNKPGTYTARVVATDDKGHKGTEEMIIEVE